VLVAAPPEVRPPARPRRPPIRALTLTPPALSLYNDCPRRFRLLHLLGLDEPRSEDGVTPELIDDLPLPVADSPDAQPRARGRAPHRVLARWPLDRWGDPHHGREIEARLVAEGLPRDGATDLRARDVAEAMARFLSGAFARAVRDEAACVRRDAPFVLLIETGPRGLRELWLRGTIDLVIERGDDTSLVLAYTLAAPHGDLGAHELPLRVAALAAARRRPGVRARAGLIFLRHAPEPVWLEGEGEGGALSDDEHAAFERELAAVGQSYAEARYTDRFEGVSLATCRQLRCGFVRACHGDKKLRGRSGD